MYSDGAQYIQPSTSRDYMCTFLDVGSRDFRYTLKTTGRLGIGFTSATQANGWYYWDLFLQLEAGCHLITAENGYVRLTSCSQPTNSTQILTKQNGTLNWKIINNDNNTVLMDYTMAIDNYASQCRYLGVSNATGSASSIQEILVEAL